MEIAYRLQGAEFQWDEEKARLNVENTGSRSSRQLRRSWILSAREGMHRRVESRDFVLGYSLAQRLLLVIHTERSAAIRIISARPATRAERKLYEQA